eukprot:XP_001693649.1 predicted protein [Chlamydomonas reinhardtii]
MSIGGTPLRLGAGGWACGYTASPAPSSLRCGSMASPTGVTEPAAPTARSRQHSGVNRSITGRSGKRRSTSMDKPEGSDGLRLKGSFPRSPAQITAAFTSCTSLEQLLATLQSLHVAGSEVEAVEASLGVAAAADAKATEEHLIERAQARTHREGPAAHSPPRRRTLNAVQLSAALTTAEWLASRASEGEGGRASEAAVVGASPGPASTRADGGTRPQGTASAAGLLAPPCRPLSPPVATALGGVLARHSEVLADANPPEMAAAMWAAARLRLRLPREALEPVLEAVWLWDPADLAANRQEWEEADAGEAEAGAPTQLRRRGRQGAAADSMGARELCLLLYSVSVVGIVSALARAGARLDEEGMEFVMQACSCRLSAFSTAQLSGLLAATQRWSSGTGGEGAGSRAVVHVPEVRHRAACLGSREVCEALRLMAELRRGGHQPGIAAWKEGLRALLQRWAQCLQPGEGGQACAAMAEGDGNGSSPTGASMAAEDARTLATTLHAVKQLGVRLHARESAAVAAALWRQAPVMRQLADCAMCLTAVEDGVLAGPGADSETARGPQVLGEQAGASDVDLGAEWTWQASTHLAAGDAGNMGGGSMRLGVAERHAVDALLRRSGELLRQQHLQQHGRQPQLMGGQEVTHTAGRRPQQHRQRVGELVCLVRAAAAAGAYPPADWWAAWGGCVQLHGRTFSAAEAADVLFSLARLQQRQQPWKWRTAMERRRSSQQTLQGARKRQRAVKPASGNAHSATTTSSGGGLATQVSAQGCVLPLPIPRHLLVALLAVALGVPPEPGSSQAASGSRRGTGLGPISAYYLVWAVERLQLSADVEPTLWAVPLSAAVTRALPLLTPRKQVHLMRSATRAWRAANLQLPAPVVQSWWRSFGSAAVAQAQAATLAHAAAVTAEAGLVPPPGWAAEMCRAAAACAGQLSARDAAALVSGMRLRRRLGLHSRSTLSAAQLRLDGSGADRAESPAAAAAPLAGAVNEELGLARVLLRAMRRKATQPPGARDRALARQLAWLLSRFLAAAQGAGSSSRSSSSSERVGRRELTVCAAERQSGGRAVKRRMGAPPRLPPVDDSGGGGGGGGGWGWERTARNLAPNLFVMGLYFFVTSYGGDNFGGGGHGGGGDEDIQD